MRTLFEWRTDYETGNRQIDNEHRWLFALAQQVVDASGPAKRTAEAHSLLELYRYARVHFDHEEQAMRLHAYPALIDHMALHEKLTAALDRVAAPGLDPQRRQEELKRLMLKWVAGHITVADRAFARFLDAKGVVSETGELGSGKPPNSGGG